MNYPWDEEISTVRTSSRRAVAFGVMVALTTAVMGLGLSLAYAGLQPDRKALAQPVVHPTHGVARISALHYDLADTPEMAEAQTVHFANE